MNPSLEKIPAYSWFINVLDFLQKLGVPVALSIKIQVNLAVRSSAGNPITKPLHNKVLPLIWFSLVSFLIFHSITLLSLVSLHFQKIHYFFYLLQFCTEPPPQIVNLLRLRLVIAPPLLITVEVLLFIIGFILGVQGFHRIWKPKYKLIEPLGEDKDKYSKPARKRSMERLRNSVILNVLSDNIGFHNDDDLAKEAVSLLAITEEDNDCHEMPDLLADSWNNFNLA